MATKSQDRDGPNTSKKRSVSIHAKSMSKLFERQSVYQQRATITLSVPNTDPKRSLYNFTTRYSTTVTHPNYHMESIINMPEITKHKSIDEADVLSRCPSYRKFRIPYEMICAKRYVDSLKTYEAQLEHEIRQNIDFQGTAADACYFVRCMAYTTFWPPLHNMTEVNHVGKHFFQLTEREKWRLKNIMMTDIT